MAGSIDYASVFKTISANDKFRESSFLIAQEKFIKAKNIFLKDFNKHPVTIEISGGPESANISGTLGGYGNLFSFLGFQENRKPIEEVFEAMENLFSISRKANNALETNYIISYPSINDLKKYSPLPWAFGGSWISGIEKGIPNFSRYIHDDMIINSRSGAGIEAKNNVRNAVFIPTSYLTPLLENFKRNLDLK